MKNLEEQAEELYEKIREEFEKGSPNSELNLKVNTFDKLIVYSMVLFAKETTYQALDEAAEEMELLQEKISPGYYNQGDIKECDFNDGLHDAIDVILSLKEKH